MPKRGITAFTRHPRVPEVPTINEAGVPGFEVTSWTGMCAPIAVPKPIVVKIEADMQKLLAMPPIRQRLSDMGVDPDPMGSAQFTALVKAETVKWTKVVKDAGIPPQ